MAFNLLSGLQKASALFSAVSTLVNLPVLGTLVSEAESLFPNANSGAQKLAWFFQSANEKYAKDYPAKVGQHMTNTDSGPFQDIIPAISLRENERGEQIGAGWDPHWHQPTDIYANFNDKDFLLGLNAAQTTLGAVAELAGARMKE